MLYIFGKNEQLLAVLKNDGRACPYFDAVHKEQLNGENTFTFAVPAGHVDARYVAEGNLAMFKDPDNNWQLFEIKKPRDMHDLSGLIRTAYCEHAFYELLDDFITDLRPTNVSAHFALTQALYSTRWQVGTVADLGQNSTNFYYESALSAVQKVRKVWGGELRFRVVVAGGIITERRVDLLARRGAETGKQFVYGKDIEEVQREVDMTSLATALYGRGKGVEVETGGYGRRLTFAEVAWSVSGGDPVDKPLGQEWVGDPDALAQWGRPDGRHRFGVFEGDDETDPVALLQKTWDALQAVKAPRVTYWLSVLTLEQLSGYAHEKARLGDTVRCIDRKFSPELLVAGRVVEISRDLLEPNNTRVILDSFAPSMVDRTLEQEEVLRSIRDRQGVWDRAGQFNPDGTLSPSVLEDTLVGLQHELQLAEEAVQEAHVAVGAITTPKIADSAVNAQKIQDATITAIKLAQGAVTTEKIADNAITDMKLAAGTITEQKMKWNTHILY